MRPFNAAHGSALQYVREASQRSHLQADEPRQGKKNFKGLNDLSEVTQEICGKEHILV